jgi:hypothetical protein
VGLYGSFSKASAALKNSELRFSKRFPTLGLETSPKGGRPPEDYILSLRDAQKFAARTRTMVGSQICDLLIDHHEEFQKLLHGDQEAHKRLQEQASGPAVQAPVVPVGIDPQFWMMGQLMGLTREEVAKLQQGYEAQHAHIAQIESQAQEARELAEHALEVTERTYDALCNTCACAHT